LGLDAVKTAHEMVAKLAGEGINSPILSLLDDVASMHLETDLEVVERRCDSLVAGWPNTGDLDRSQFRLGLAFQIADGAEKLLPVRTIKARALAEFSNAMLTEVVDSLELPTRVFAVNHIVYVSTLFDLRPANLEQLVEELAGFVDGNGTEEEPYRFLDTLAWFHLSMAERNVLDPSARKMELDLATRYLERAISRAPFDSELREHARYLADVKEVLIEPS
jgi:hypothetical protein